MELKLFYFVTTGYPSTSSGTGGYQYITLTGLGVGMENLMMTMNFQLRLTRVKYPFFAIAAQRKNKRKKDTA